MDALLMPHYAAAALVTIDTQVDTLDGQPLEIPGTSEVVPNVALLCQAFREARQPVVHIVLCTGATAATPNRCDGRS